MNKVLYLIDYPLDLPGGAQLSTRTICDCIAENSSDYVVAVIGPKSISNERYNYKVYEIEGMSEDDNGIVLFFKYLRYYIKTIRDFNPDIIHAQMPLAAKFLGIMRWMGLFPKCKVVFTDRGCYGYSKISKILFRIIMPKIDRVICTTDYNEKLWKKDYPSLKKFDVVYNCVTPIFDSMSQNSNQKQSDSLVIGFAGRMTEMKNWPLCKQIIHGIYENPNNIIVNVVLSAYGDSNKKKAQHFEDEMKQLYSNKVTVLHELSQEEMVLFYKNLDIFVLTSINEAFGKTAIEAMACSCVVIGTDGGGLPEVIGKNENVYQVDRPEDCISRILEYAEDLDTLERDKKWFHERYMRNYSVQNNYEGYINVYEKLLSE